MKAFPIFVIALFSVGILLMGCTSGSHTCEEEKGFCEYQCGDGVFAGFCKEKCAYDYRACIRATPTPYPTDRPPY